MFFERFKISLSFLTTDPSTWEFDNDFIAGKQKVQNLRVVTDNAERGVKLMGDYNQLLTKDEEDLQFLLQVVTDYRKKYSGCDKTTLSENKYDEILE